MTKAQSMTANQPLYLQIAQSISDRILDRSFHEGGFVPSIRQYATDFKVHPMTVNKAYQRLVALSVICSKPGLGMMVCEGARDRLLIDGKARFFQVDLPAFIHQADVLEISRSEIAAHLLDQEGDNCEHD